MIIDELLTGALERFDSVMQERLNPSAAMVTQS